MKSSFSDWLSADSEQITPHIPNKVLNNGVMLFFSAMELELH